MLVAWRVAAEQEHAKAERKSGLAKEIVQKPKGDREVVAAGRIGTERNHAETERKSGLAAEIVQKPKGNWGGVVRSRDYLISGGVRCIRICVYVSFFLTALKPPRAPLKPRTKGNSCLGSLLRTAD